MKEKINFRRLGITVGIVLLTALVVGGTIWYLKQKEIRELNQTNSLEKIETLATSYCELSTRPSDDELLSYVKNLPEIKEAKIETDEVAGRVLRIGYIPFDGGGWADQGWNLECNDTEKVVSENVEGTQEEGASGPNTFDVTKVKVGDKFAGMTVVSVGKSVEESTIPYGRENATVVFSGQATLTGEYEYDTEAIIEDWLSYKPNSATSTLLPKEIKQSDAGFLFDNNVAAMSMLGITKGVNKIGNATIIVKDYTFSIVPGEGGNSATLVSVK